MSILRDISILLNAGVINQETADNIQAYYSSKEQQSTNRLFLVFGILGALLVGMGIILIIAHNWDHLSRTTKAIFAFLPLLLGQVVCGFVLVKKPTNITWIEGSSSFLFFAVGACIALISQIYHIQGSLTDFLFTCMLLCLPLIYIMKSNMVSLLYIVGITYYAGLRSYAPNVPSESYWYWGLLLLVFPHYYHLYKQKSESNFTIYHSWLIPLSILIILGTVAKANGEWMFLAYFSLFGIYFLIGESYFFKNQRLIHNGYKILGTLGTTVLLLILSFDWYWVDLSQNHNLSAQVLKSPECIVATLTTFIAAALFFNYQKDKSWMDVDPWAFMFILFMLTFVLGFSSPYAYVLINVFVLSIGIIKVRKGALEDHLGILNYGLVLITALILCRFFDTELSFITRGILFMIVGIGFFAANYWRLRKRKTNG